MKLRAKLFLNNEIIMSVNENRNFLNFKADSETADLKALDNYFGYLRIYFRNT